MDSFNLPGLNVDKLYIKLDKKLIVQIKKIKIKFRKSKNNSKDELILAIKRLPLMDKFFSTIDIKDMDIDGNRITLLYEDDIFYLDSKYLTLNTKLSPKGENLKASINSLVLKDFDLLLKGEMIFDIKKYDGNFTGRYKTHNIKGDMDLNVKNSILHYKLNSENFTSLEPFMTSLNKKIDIREIINSWIYKKITATDYKLEFMGGKFNLKDNNFYPKSMSAVAKVKNVKIKFHPKVPYAFTKNLNVVLKNNKLHFVFDKAYYKNFKLKKSDIHIYNLLTKGAGIVVNLITNAPLNRDIQTILKAYKLKIPVLQTSGKSDSKLTLDMGFEPFSIDAKGEFIVKNSNIKISNAPFYTKHAHAILDNNSLLLKNTNLTYKNIFDISSTGEFDLKNRSYDGQFDIKSLQVSMSKNNFINLKNKTFPAHFNIEKNGLTIDIDKINTHLGFYENRNIIAQKELSLVYDYSPFMKKSSIYGGSLNLYTKDFKKYDVDLNISKMKPFFSKNKKPVTALNLHINIDDAKSNIKSKNGCLEVSEGAKGGSIYINDCDILVKSDSNSSSFKSKTTVKANKSNIILQDYNKTIPFNSFSANLYKDYLYFDGKYKKGVVSLIKKPKQFSLKAKNIDDNFINNIIKQDIFNEGSFNADIKGKDFKNFSGYFHFGDTYIESFSFYNNLIAFINSIPSLLTFKQPSFNEKGYAIKKADILFSREKDRLKIHSIDILGIDADIVGNGEIDLKTKNIDIKINLKTLKVVSGILEKIPLVNYILLGKDKSISTFISIKGTLDNPKIETQTAQDVVLTPFYLIKRTITLPFSLFE